MAATAIKIKIVSFFILITSTTSNFVGFIILYQPKEWKIFSCSLKQKHLSFSKRPFQVLCKFKKLI